LQRFSTAYCVDIDPHAPCNYEWWSQSPSAGPYVHIMRCGSTTLKSAVEAVRHSALERVMVRWAGLLGSTSATKRDAGPKPETTTQTSPAATRIELAIPLGFEELAANRGFYEEGDRRGSKPRLSLKPQSGVKSPR